MNSITVYADRNIRSHRALRVRAFGSLDGWFYSIHSADDLRPLVRDCGPLPSDYQYWNRHSATLYSLAQAQRHIAEHFPGSRVVMICAAAPTVRKQRRRAA